MPFPRLQRTKPKIPIPRYASDSSQACLFLRQAGKLKLHLPSAQVPLPRIHTGNLRGATSSLKSLLFPPRTSLKCVCQFPHATPPPDGRAPCQHRETTQLFLPHSHRPRFQPQARKLNTPLLLSAKARSGRNSSGISSFPAAE